MAVGVFMKSNDRVSELKRKANILDFRLAELERKALECDAKLQSSREQLNDIARSVRFNPFALHVKDGHVESTLSSNALVKPLVVDYFKSLCSHINHKDQVTKFTNGDYTVLVIPKNIKKKEVVRYHE